MRNNTDYLIAFVVGARPNFIKVAPILKEVEHNPRFRSVLIHTGQHFDNEMSQLFFRDLKMRKPDYNLDINGSSHAELTAKMLVRLESILIQLKPDIVVVVGDVDSTLAASLAAAKLCIPIAHVEAGLRSFDREMPEEINRIVTDRLSELLFIHSEDAKTNLLKEGISSSKIFYTGNIMIDMLKLMLNKIKGNAVLKKYHLTKTNYSLLTLHRPSNVDNREIFIKILKTVVQVSKKLPIVFPVHPRTAAQLKKFRFNRILSNTGVITMGPLGYVENLGLLKDSKFVLTDSGGIQEETTYLGIPCLTLRKNTERPVTVEIGTNIIVDTDKNKILFEVEKILDSRYKKGKIPRYWDGHTAERIVKVLKERLYK
jgi:UDP-N-acetylglucosamine 2-epimerase (non-hydrolysing)